MEWWKGWLHWSGAFPLRKALEEGGGVGWGGSGDQKWM